MKIIDIVPKEICVNIELSEEEIDDLLNFFDKAIPLYAKVYSDGPIENSERGAEGFTLLLKRIQKAIKTETKNEP